MYINYLYMSMYMYMYKGKYVYMSVCLQISAYIYMTMDMYTHVVRNARSSMLWGSVVTHSFTPSRPPP